MFAYTWQCPDHKRAGVDDMTLLSQINDVAIAENLKKRFDVDWIFTYIGPVLVSVNPFKQMKYFTQREVDMYQGAATYENPPHIYSLADNMYRNMTSDLESQCVIISGESGAGKTVCAKFIMNYLSQVSGGGATSQQVKDVILKSNPLLEAFGNAKTVRNNNSSRFGKYVEILFAAGQPTGGKISNFLLEKSRVVTQNPLERNFHIFYQLISGLKENFRDDLGVTDPDYYNYLNEHDCYKIDGTDDRADYEELIEAMETMNFTEAEKFELFALVFAILHLGNVTFVESKNDEAQVQVDASLDYPSCLLRVNKEQLQKKLTSRVMETRWGSTVERVDVTLNVQQAELTRDALAKGLYSRLFDYLVKRVNEALETPTRRKVDNLTLGILDIFGFEIFQKNGFEQFCINYVNEKLQQIFIELTLKAEQEEYVQEGIAWKEISYFNNAIVCQLIEEKKPKPGIMAILDDVCASQHGVTDGADQNLQAKLRDACRQHKFFEDSSKGFVIHHYAGVVSYDVRGFCDRNRDIFNDDLIELMQSSGSNLIGQLFKEKLASNQGGAKKRPVTASAKIKSQANELVKSLMQCNPHYIRCIKPNETKRPRDWDKDQVKHQVEYLGLKENVRIRRAGFAYRRSFEKFLQRYAILTKETWPNWHGDIRKGVIHILTHVNMKADEYQLGKSKLFIKAPESLFLLEEQREKKFDHYARVIQKAFRKHFNQQKLQKQKEEASDILYQKKERRQFSVNRQFFEDYIGLDDQPAIKNLVGKRDKILFAQTINRYDRRYKGLKSAKRDLIVNSKGIFLIGREPDKNAPNKSQLVETITRHITMDHLYQVSLSTMQDDFVILHVTNSYDSLLQVPFKTEFLTVLKKLKEEKTGGKSTLKTVFSNNIEFVSDKSSLGAGKKRKITFVTGNSNQEEINAQGILKKDITVAVGAGLPNTTRPKHHQPRANQRPAAKKQPTGGYQGQRPLAGPGAPLPSIPRHASPVRAAPAAPANQQRFSRESRKFRQQSIESKVPLQPNINVLRQQMEQTSGFKNRRVSREQQQPVDLGFLSQRQGGQAEAFRQSAVPTPAPRPVPGGGRPKPRINAHPRAKAIYSYQATDTDELSLDENEIVEVLEEDPSGWWKGQNSKGETGLFPGAYVEKM